MKVFLRYFLEIPFPIKEIDRVITELPGEWLDLAARDANLRGLLMLGALPTDEPDLSAGDLCVSISAPEVEGTLLRRALQWLTIRGDAHQPVLQGDLELAELGPSRTQLALSAQYRPSAHVAQSSDRMMAQRVGESTLKAFVDRLADYVQTIAGEPSAVPAGPANWSAAVKTVGFGLSPGWLAAP